MKNGLDGAGGRLGSLLCPGSPGSAFQVLTETRFPLRHP